MRAAHTASGAHPLPAGQTRFALWAPAAQRVEVHIDGQAQALQAEGDGWFGATLAGPAGSRYHYRVDGGPALPDPASRAQVGDVHGDSQVVDLGAYRWQVDDWRGRPWHETVLYEVHPGLFGGFRGLEAFLPRLVELGVTALELMPLGAFSGERNWGYDGVLPYAPASAYGSPQDLQRLIDQAHALGLMVFIDVVYNHFGPDGNYLHSYAKAFFRDDQQTPWGPAIDFRQEPVRRFFIDNALMWVRDYRVDGLRLDAVHAIGDARLLVDLADEARRAANGRHLHLVLENEHNQAGLLRGSYQAQWNDDFHNVLHVLLTGEQEGYYADFKDNPTQRLARCLSEGFIYQGEPTRRGEPRGEPSADLPPTAFVSFLQNHDQTGNRALGERLASLAEPAALRASVALLLLCPMIPLLFMGEDWGERRPFFYFTDFHGDLARAVCEGRREEFREFAHFSSSDAAERIPDPNAVDTFEASRPDLRNGDCQCRGYYRRLLELRHAEIIPRLAGARALGAAVLGERAVAARWLLGDGSRLHILLNLGRETLPVPRPAGARVLFCEGQPVEAYRDGQLGPNAIVISLEESV
ncbi:MAG: Malto-oligosyltrehalose trehalohydrolase [Pseudomonas citronellolis]|nr:MAG: Malto-oligosyltrehalose trehalohydrolase [Pseudomonas citronellolis]